MGKDDPAAGGVNRTSTERKIRRRLLPRFAMLLILAMIGLLGMSFMAGKPDNLGVTSGKLAACPDTPNCVSTQTSNESQRMEPVVFSRPLPDAIEVPPFSVPRVMRVRVG